MWRVPESSAEKRPATLEVGLPTPPGDADASKEDVSGSDGQEMVCTGPEAVLRQRMVDDELLKRFEAI